MKVVALKTGYYNLKRYYEGDEFELVPLDGHKQGEGGRLSKVKRSPEEQFSKHWMRKVEDLESEAPAPKRKGKPEHHAHAAQSGDVL